MNGDRTVESDENGSDSDSEYECSNQGGDIDYLEGEEDQKSTTQKKRKRERVENEQTRKLRRRDKNLKEEEEEEEEKEESSEEEDDEDVGMNSESSRFSMEEGEIQKKKVKDMWQLAAVQDFFLLLKSLQLWSGNVVFTLDELDHALVHSNGAGLIAKLHMDLIIGISPKSQVSLDNWAQYLSNRLKPYPEVNFKPSKGQEIQEYSTLSSSDRVLCLLALCCCRAECEDFRSAIDVFVRPSSAPKKLNSCVGLEQFRRNTIGSDSAGNAYYFIDLESMGAGVRMYKENSSGKQWQCLGSSIECIKTVADELANNCNPTDEQLADKIGENVVAALEERRENQRRQEKRAKRLQLDLNNIIVGEGRQTRVRKNVDYTFNHVFDEINQAIQYDQGYSRSTRQQNTRSKHKQQDDGHSLSGNQTYSKSVTETSRDEEQNSIQNNHSQSNQTTSHSFQEISEQELSETFEANGNVVEGGDQQCIQVKSKEQTEPCIDETQTNGVNNIDIQKIKSKVQDASVDGGSIYATTLIMQGTGQKVSS
eukprot:TRINITY_DN16437_c0_g1_i1.p1 TRINITY_DN16437_c0_g1~~TRINITY_DN16437_c0_g1_i1.p1  ORF type:complete len:537 (-),score=73.84 TRINITY_DN16437_c0_g1_i1:311-1921(-)